MVKCRIADIAVSSQGRKKNFNFRCAHLFGVTLAMKKNIALNPMRVRLLSPAAIVFEANFSDNLIKKLGRR
jgi:hypothetical protein